MAAQVQVLSSHPLLIRAAERLLAEVREFAIEILPAATCEGEAMRAGVSGRLFLLDGCSLRTDLGRLAQWCRARAPGSRFLALLPPEGSSVEEMLRLFFWGIDGLVELHGTWEAELPVALSTILAGQIWLPRAAMAAYLSHMRSLLHAQLLPGHSLTAREGQVLQLLMRRLANKEISSTLGISQRTVKFHVSNILSKLQLQDRRSLSPSRLAPEVPVA